MAVGVVQTKENSSGSAGQASIATGSFNSDVTAGNLLFWVLFHDTGSNTNITWSDTRGLSYTQIGEQAIGPYFKYGYAPITSSGPQNTTATFASGNRDYPALWIAELSGIRSSGYYTSGEHSSNFQPTPGTGADAITTGATPTLAFQPAIEIAFSFNYSGAAPPNPNGAYTALSSAWYFGGGSPYAKGAWRRLTSTAAVTSTWTATGGGNNHYSAHAIFREADPAVALSNYGMMKGM